MANKAIIGLERMGTMQARALEIARRADMGEAMPEADYHLISHSRSTVQRTDPGTPGFAGGIKRLGSLSIYALAKQLGRNYSNVHADIGKLLELGLVEKNEAGKVFVPWDEVQIRLTLGGAAAA